jgi:hypothetical protein
MEVPMHGTSKLKPTFATPRPQTVTGQNLAKQRRNDREKTVMALRWMQGTLVIEKPTVKQAAALFGVSAWTLNSMLYGMRNVESLMAQEAAAAEAAWQAKSTSERMRILREGIDQYEMA